MSVDFSLPKYFRCDKCGQYIMKIELPSHY